jgi:hypothetical protein
VPRCHTFILLPALRVAAAPDVARLLLVAKTGVRGIGTKRGTYLEQIHIPAFAHALFMLRSHYWHLAHDVDVL